MNELIKQVEQWSADKGLNKSDPTKQFLKVTEEVGEVAAALARNDMDMLKDGIGDVVVTLIILAQQNGTNLEECLNVAYNEIKGRTGMMIDGVFVKSEDLEGLTMAITKEALTYLQELELNPDWTKIPDSDSRIIKLRELFYSDERKVKGVHQKGYGKKLKVIVGSTPILFESVAKCSNALGLSKYSIYSALKNGTKLKGMLFEEVDI